MAQVTFPIQSASPTRATFDFMGLPPELREMVYERVDDRYYYVHIDTSNLINPVPVENNYIRRVNEHFCALSLINRQIRQETLPSPRNRVQLHLKLYRGSMNSIKVPSPRFYRVLGKMSTVEIIDYPSSLGSAQPVWGSLADFDIQTNQLAQGGRPNKLIIMERRMTLRLKFNDSDITANAGAPCGWTLATAVGVLKPGDGVRRNSMRWKTSSAYSALKKNQVGQPTLNGRFDWFFLFNFLAATRLYETMVFD